MDQKFEETLTDAQEVYEIARGIVEDALTNAFLQIDNNNYKLCCVRLHYDALTTALEDILNVYDKPKPCNDHSHIIGAWKQDKPAKPSDPDILIKNCI